MNTAEIRAALNTVEQDHRLVLNKMQALKDAVNQLLDPEDSDLEPVLHRLRDSNEFFATQFASHMAEEETTLFPLLEQLQPEGPALVARLRQEHAEIRRKREEFGNCLELAVELEEGLTTMVRRDLLAYGWELLELLDNHAHAETQAVHQCVMTSFQVVAGS
jgi:iron-sulfur cluster repair protein YtfE (RIC family)